MGSGQEEVRPLQVWHEKSVSCLLLCSCEYKCSTPLTRPHPLTCPPHPHTHMYMYVVLLHIIVTYGCMDGWM